MNPLLLYLIPAIVLIGLTVRWFRIGRDPKKRKDLPIKYAPPKGLTPAEAGVIIDERADAKDIVATFFDLASRRHFSMEDLGDDVKLHLIQDYEDDPGLEKHEKALLKIIFGRKESVMLSERKEQLKNEFVAIKKELYEVVTAKGFFERNPEKARSDYLKIAIILWSLGVIVTLFGYQSFFFWRFFLHGNYALLISGLCFVLFSKFMPKKTKKGHELFEHLLGLQKFLRNPLAAQGKYEGYADEKTYFEKLLPFAIAFDATSDWLSANVRLYQTNPPFYAKTKRNFRDFVELIREYLG